MPPKSPRWTREEIILALDLYYRHGRRVADDCHPDVIQVSRFLNQLPIHDQSVRAPNFRNPNGVALKIANLRAVNPAKVDRLKPMLRMLRSSHLWAGQKCIFHRDRVIARPYNY